MSALPARLAPYVLAVGCAMVATALKISMSGLIGEDQSHFVLYPAAILIAAWQGGLWPGALCTLLAAFSVDYFFMQPEGELTGITPAEKVSLLLFAGEGLLISLVCEALRRARSDAATHQIEAQDALDKAHHAAAEAVLARHASDAHQRRFQRLFDSNIVSIYVAEADGRIVEANDAFRSLTGCAAELLKQGDCNWRQMTPSDHARRDAEALDEINRTGVCQPYEKEFLRADGVRVPVLLGCAETDRSGRLICFAVDLTTQRAVTQRLANAMAAVEAGSRAKSEFVANISHELRTPMNAILGMTELALADELPERTRGFLETSKASADALLNLLNDLLDFSRLEAGQFAFRPQPVHLADVYEEAVRTLSLRAQEKKLNLQWHVSSDVPKWLVADAARLRQILVNLVGNAIKFTEQGGVEISAELAELKQGTAHVHLEVRDTGIGIAPADQKRIFEAFMQVDASATRRFTGTGLGLSITRQLVMQMGGQIWVESELERGTTFHCFLALPVSEPPADDVQNRRSPRIPRVARPLHILVAEDTPANQKLVRAILERYSHTCDVALDGMEMLDYLAAENYDAILLDVQMPRMDGIQAAREVRRLADPVKASIPIVAMTAHALDSDRDRCLAAGMNDYVSKPLSASKLIEVLESVVGEADEQRQAAPPGKAPVESAEEDMVNSMVECFDYQESLKRLGDDQELFCAMARCYVEDADGLLHEIAAGNQRGEANRVERAAHSLKGLAATFSAAAVVSRAQFIEQCGRQADLTRARAVLPDLIAESEKLKSALQPYAMDGKT